MQVYSPLGVEGLESRGLAPRAANLQGKVVGLLGNVKPNADVLLKTAGELLKQRYGARDVVFEEKNSPSLGAPEEMLNKLASHCDVAIVGLGD